MEENEPEDDPTAAGVDTKSKKVNHALGQLAALGMGGMVVAINRDHGPLMASVAGVKQYVYSSIIAVLLIDIQHRIYDHLKEQDKKSLVPDLLSIALPAIGTTLATFAVHSLKGTPETINSTLPTAILAPIGYTLLHIRRVMHNSNT